MPKHLPHQTLFKSAILLCTFVALAAVATYAMTHRDNGRAEFIEWYGKQSPAEQTLMTSVGLSPETAIFARANFDSTMTFAASVFEKDGEFYAPRPNASGIWVRQKPTTSGQGMTFLIGDSPEVRKQLADVNWLVVSEERYNALGCRGTMEQAEVRILDLGDSFIEGIGLADHETVSARLQARLRPRLSASVLNAGVIGYSTEQEHHRLTKLFDSYKPTVVVLHFFANDIHLDHHKVLQGKGDWSAARIWLQRIRDFCKSKDAEFVLSVIPDRWQLESTGEAESNYQSKLASICPISRSRWINPLSRFASVHGAIKGDISDARADPDFPLYLKNDSHFSAKGADIYAELVAETILRLLDKR